jgi:hypothetical protein
MTITVNHPQSTRNDYMTLFLVAIVILATAVVAVTVRTISDDTNTPSSADFGSSTAAIPPSDNPTHFQAINEVWSTPATAAIPTSDNPTHFQAINDVEASG